MQNIQKSTNHFKKYDGNIFKSKVLNQNINIC